jgi:hypothetical protein
MRLSRIEFKGYKRLAATGCNVDGRLVAFVGPNEAGKSSVLEALGWLSWGRALPGPSVSRSREVTATTEVVRATWLLNDDDRAALSDLDTPTTALRFISARRRDGDYAIGVDPELRRNPVPFEQAAKALKDFRGWEPSAFVVDENSWKPGDWEPRVEEVLVNPDEAWTSDQQKAFVDLIDWLRHQVEEKSLAEFPLHAAEQAADALAAVRDVMRSDHPNDVARQRLNGLCPKFLLFEESDRVLATEYNLTDQEFRRNPPQALVNLLAVGGTSLAKVIEVRESGNITAQKTFVARVNRRLEQRLRSAWRQSDLAISIDIDGNMLQVLVDELDDETGARTAITERSDGLRTFIALTSFLAAKAITPAPILLIDEAETHLHLDAQADLVDFLLNLEQASQVIYTTHSPGCLPPDLGTGVRLVQPSPEQRDQSLLRGNFWDSKDVGFSPLLFAMGAGAAAFSTCRYAVLAEGPSDMILLPSLIRQATGVPSLQYQIAPGLSGFRGQDLAIDEIAARVAYLADGDGPGQDYAKELSELGFPQERIFTLPEGMATEDLLDPAVYLTAVNEHLKETGASVQVTCEELDGDDTIAHAVAAWCKNKDIAAPGKVAIASRLIQKPEELRLTPSGAEALRQLHGNLGNVLRRRRA